MPWPNVPKTRELFIAYLEHILIKPGSNETLMLSLKLKTQIRYIWSSIAFTWKSPELEIKGSIFVFSLKSKFFLLLIFRKKSKYFVSLFSTLKTFLQPLRMQMTESICLEKEKVGESVLVCERGGGGSLGERSRKREGERH